MRTVLPLTLFVTALAGGSAVAGQPATPPPDAVARAEAAMNALQSALVARLGEEMKRGGPATAVTVCRDEAPLISARIAREQGLALGRTSDRLRNPKNAAPAWAEDIVRETAGTKAAAHRLRTVDLADRVGVLRPIGFADMCGACHGAAAQIPAPVGAVIAAAYPQDAAVGFTPGDLRGWMWVEVPKP